MVFSGVKLSLPLMCLPRFLWYRILFSSSFFCLLRGFQSTHSTWRFPGQKSNRSCSYWHTPQPQPQQCQIRAKSATYTTVHSNAGPITHCVRPGIEPASSWILVSFVPLSHDRNVQNFKVVYYLLSVIAAEYHVYSFYFLG